MVDDCWYMVLLICDVCCMVLVVDGEVWVVEVCLKWCEM